VNLFTQVATQWRVGMGGPIGLDYNVLFRLLDMADLSKEDWEQSFEEVRVMEAAALEAMRQD
jgi:hypothetical protein